MLNKDSLQNNKKILVIGLFLDMMKEKLQLEKRIKQLELQIKNLDY